MKLKIRIDDEETRALWETAKKGAREAVAAREPSGTVPAVTRER
jgi:hypothetical protein